MYWHNRCIVTSSFCRAFNSSHKRFSTKRYDAIIIGAGHNGLVCGNVLAKHGKKVVIVERRHVVGGAAVTEEVYNRFKNA